MLITGAVLRSSPAAPPYAESRPLALLECELDAPGPTEVLVRIEAAGLCHSDLSVVNGNRPRPVPMLLGHEAAGIVIEVGSEVTDIATGTRVTTVFLPRCEDCAACATGGKLPCSTGTASNVAGTLPSGRRALALDGAPVFHHIGVSGFATHAVLDRRSVVPVGEDVPPEIAAVLGCAVLTGGGAVRNAGALQPGQDVIVVGLGGVGMAAVLTAAAITGPAGGTVYGIDANLDKLEHVREFGAADGFTPQQATERGLRAPLVVEAAGHPRAFETAVELTAPGGITVTAGLPSPDARAVVAPLGITAEARTIVGSYLGSAVPTRDIPEYEQLWRNGDFPVEKLISSRIPLSQINEALDELDQGHAIRQIITFEP